MTMALPIHLPARTMSVRPLRRADSKPSAIDLFAGCGGLSLGLERAGFRPLFVNELDSDAMATYLLNRLRDHPQLVKNREFDIYALTGNADTLGATASELKRQAGPGGVDVVAGGPPCQGYSGIGHRRTFTELRKIEIPSNHLYVEMAKFIQAIRPKVFLFENVRGLLSQRWTPDGEPGELWDDVQRTFGEIPGYQTRWKLVQAKQYGVPQNRPRILLVGIRNDLGWRPDAGKSADGLLPEPAGTPADPEDFLGDLVDPDYREKSSTTSYPRVAETESEEWYRTDPHSGRVASAGAAVTEQDYSKHRPRVEAKFEYMLKHNGEIRDKDRTKKFAQRVIPAEWGPTGPTITATSLPDDYVHYSQPRVLTVREWARMQTFPDWYQFAGKRTTGGRRRAGDPDAGDWSREVPKYTQIGNAVPVRLAEAVGRHLIDLLR
jgi:DNA (cytosine-5)-methyltransferase 1